MHSPVSASHQSSVQELLSSQSMSAYAQSPVAASQASSVQASASSQSTAAPPQVPSAHASL